MKSTHQKSRQPDPRESELKVVLVAVTGQSPAIVVETVWALAHESPSIVPERIICITTTSGREAIIKELLCRSPHGSVWEQLRAALLKKGVKVEGKLQFGSTGDDIRVVTGKNATTDQSFELDDIRSAEDNNAVGDFILRQLRGLMATPGIQVVANLAGGRKTMGALMYACMSLIGRETDRLTHVLIPPEFEQPLMPKFYFPAQSDRHLKARDGTGLDARSATITLAEVPFVSLRNLFDREQLTKPQSFAELVARSRTNISSHSVKLTIYRSKSRCEVNGQPVETSAPEHLLVLKLGQMCRDGAPPIIGYKIAVDAVEAYARELGSTFDSKNFSDWRGKLFKSDQKGQRILPIDERFLIRNLSSLRKKLEKMPDEARALIRYLPAHGRFSIDLPQVCVDIKD